MTPKPTSTVLSRSPGLLIQLPTGYLHLMVPQAPQNLASLKLNPWPSPPNIFLRPCSLIREWYYHPPSCLNQLLKASSSSPPSPLFPLYYQISWFFLQIFSQTIHDNSSKWLERKMIYLILTLPATLKEVPMDILWILWPSGHKWTLLELSANLFTLSW